MIKLIKIIILLSISLVFSCSPPIQNIKTDMTEKTEKKVTGISGTLEINSIFIDTSRLLITVTNETDGKTLASINLDKLKPMMEFTINDIPIPDDKNELNIIIKFTGACCNREIKEKIVKNQLNKIG